MEGNGWQGKVDIDKTLFILSYLMTEITHVLDTSVGLGFFLEPAVFIDVTDEMMIAKEESFGPVMIISVFEDG